ncbi:DUF4419 domain-containing protein [Kibdelosporangium philippinense]|uniref:DUF4419 domain-containing protein n=1 Tax=Kibdelosporangium philippinense TaxID=211113 RepID=UPI00360F5129
MERTISWTRSYVIELFGKLVASEANGTELFECDFTTSTETERTAGKVVLFDAYSPFFSVLLGFICGIPSITLTGTVGDWQRIRERVDELERFGLRTCGRSPTRIRTAATARSMWRTRCWRCPSRTCGRRKEGFPRTGCRARSPKRPSPSTTRPLPCMAVLLLSHKEKMAHCGRPLAGT